MPPKAVDGTSQKSLHAFFKRKSPSSSSPHQPSPSNGSPGSIEHNTITDITGIDDDIVLVTDSPPPAKRPRVSDDAPVQAPRSSLSSNYFAKATAPLARAEVGNSRHINGESSKIKSIPTVKPGASRTPSTSLSSYRLPRTAVPDSALIGTFSISSSSLGPTRTQRQEANHAEWQRRIAGGEILPRRRSLALDEAAAAEARRAAGIDVDEDGTPGMEDGGVVAIDVESDGESKAEAVGSRLAAKYAAKGSAGTGAGRGKVGGRAKKKEEEKGPSGLTYTPLEKQFMEIKAKNPDVLLMMEVGYKYKFHGEDAKAASRELGIAAFPSRNFYTASIPTHRLHIHVKKLISLGYKVGVISQTETAALKKVGENRNAPFTRELTHLFTAATYVEDPSLPSSSTVMDEPILPGSAPPPTNALVAIVEIGMGGMAVDERVRIGLVSVVPGTGDIVWDEFDDSQVRTELETRLTHLQPAELLLPATGLSKATEKVLAHFAGHTKTSASSSVRIERIAKIDTYDASFDYLTKFYQSKPKLKPSRPRLSEKDSNQIDQVDLSGVDEDEQEPRRVSVEDDNDQVAETEKGDPPDSMGLAAGLPSEEAILALVDFPKQIVIALALTVKYMKTFGLENAFRHRSSFSRFINRAHMLLSSNTLVNLEIYRNQTDGGVHGSLIWLLDHTKTRMGRRLMREWIGRPLLDVAALQARVDAIEEIMDSNTYYMEKLRSLLVNMPDLVRGLTRIQYGKAKPTEVATILVGLTRIASEFKPTDRDVFRSPLLNNILQILPSIREQARGFLDDISVKDARENIEANLWVDPEKYPTIQDAKDCISICESELDQHLKEIRSVLKRPSLTYVTVSAIEYLVEVPVRDAKAVPPKWAKISATKSVNRYHTPEVLKITKEREQHKETLAGVARQAFLSFQSDISECHSLVVVARQIAVIDCLMSLAQVAAASGYCKPEFVAEPCLHISAGRHAMVEMLRDEAYVPFDIHFSDEDGRGKVITGPNMAGKSSCVRATALIVCMAQIGSFVPASTVKLGIHDAVQTRMGASDEISRGKSTFMVELSETSDILRALTPRTLVILDELGRGTSTYDGVAIAYATLSHLAEKDCNTLFVTHYPMVAEELAREYPKQISNWHMSFEEIKLPDGSAEITFLYQLTRGLAEASFGVWCARLAGLPKNVLQTAQLRGDSLKHETQQRLLSALARRSQRLFKNLRTTSSGIEDPSETIKNALTLQKALHLLIKM
ncbi:muts domain V-domain-containing protein [Naematelia encephala]|uniref:DNA mismatch repair protein MSH3 n=1 Tax=Naematelia encephala TaxID=71784 RepID=A0A1Y2AP98_9TREE|nr:muts domain V-domain-containing protein [Naematelia encephala]